MLILADMPRAKAAEVLRCDEKSPASMIQAAKRKARGFNAYEGFAAMIYLIAGKLKLAVPRPF